MKTKKLLLGIMLFFSVIAGTLFSACEIEQITDLTFSHENIEIYAGDFNMKDYNITVRYSSGRVEVIDLSEKLISASDLVKFYKIGEDHITITYQRRSFDVDLIVKRKPFEDVIFEDVEAVYSGQYVIATVKNVPEGTTVLYPSGNKFVNAGEYTVMATLRKDDYEFTTITAKITIKKADYDVSAMVFEDTEFVYDGNPKSLEMTGRLPDGLNVTYKTIRPNGGVDNGNSATSVGQYTIVASFSGDEFNYNPVPDKTATLTINKSVFNMSAVRFESKTETFDMKSHSITINEQDLPEYVSLKSVEYFMDGEPVELTAGGVVNAGVYTVVAKFLIFDEVNYELVDDMQATLTIEKAKTELKDIYLDSLSVEYDGTEHSIFITGEVSDKIIVSYTYNGQNHTGEVHAGTYTVVASFENIDENYLAPEPLVATLVITPAEVNMADVSYEPKFFFDYALASEYIPSDLPANIMVDKVVFYKLTENVNYDEPLEEITEDGEYVIETVFRDTSNYIGLNNMRTNIKVVSTDEPCYNNLCYRLDEDYMDDYGNMSVRITTLDSNKKINGTTEIRSLVLNEKLRDVVKIESQMAYRLTKLPADMNDFLSSGKIDSYRINAINQTGLYIIVTNLSDDDYEISETFVTTIYTIGYESKLFFDYDSPKNHIPFDVPQGIEIEDVIFYEIEEINNGNTSYELVYETSVDSVTHDGKYIAVAKFSEATDYLGIGMITTEIRVIKADEPCYKNFAYKIGKDSAEMLLSDAVSNILTIDSQKIYKVNELPEDIDEFVSSDDIEDYRVDAIDQKGIYITLTTLDIYGNFEITEQFVSTVFAVEYDSKLFFSYAGATQYAPDVPTEIEIDKLVFYKVESENYNISDFDGVNGNFVEEITADGLYIVVALFDDLANGQEIHPVKTELRVFGADPCYANYALSLSDFDTSGADGILKNSARDLLTISSQTIYKTNEIIDDTEAFLSGENIADYIVDDITEAGYYVVTTSVVSCAEFKFESTYNTVVYAVEFESKMFFDYYEALAYAPDNLPACLATGDGYVTAIDKEKLIDVIYDGIDGDYQDYMDSDGYYVLFVTVTDTVRGITLNPLKTKIKVISENEPCYANLELDKAEVTIHMQYFDITNTYFWDKNEKVLSMDSIVLGNYVVNETIKSQVEISEIRLYPVDTFPIIEMFLSSVDDQNEGTSTSTEITDEGKYVIVTVLTDKEGYRIDGKFVTLVDVGLIQTSVGGA